MNIEIPDKKLFISGFLQPISKISESCVIKINDAGFSCLTCTSDTSVILFNEYKIPAEKETAISLNVADIKKIIKAIECIQNNKFVMSVDRNNISYTGRDIKFKYHLLEDGIINLPKINVEKIDKIDFPISFTLQYKTLLELLRGSTFATESNKLYIHSQGGQLLGDLTDRSRHNVDSISVPLCDYSGTEVKDVVLNFEIIRIISSVRVKQLECKINPKLGVIIFQIADSCIKTKYISSSLVK